MTGVDNMDWIEKLNAAISYIEEHITEEIDLSEVAKVACCSSYHFQRMFNYMANVPLSEYIRRRRMSLAVADLQSDGAKIIDVALKYGYDSPTAFNRAFQGIHGIAPSLVKQDGVPVKSYPPISFKITIKGVEEMNFRIEKKDAFRVVGISKSLEKEVEKNFEIVPKMWQEAAMNGTIPKLAAVMDSQPMGVLGVSVCNDLEEWRYYIAVSSTKEVDATLEEYTIQPYTWAIFSGEGPQPHAIQDLQKRVVTEWLPSSGYEYDNGPDIEVYLNDNPQNSKFEVWLPIRKSQ
jgi:AraC family transcriptional regulator